MAKFNPFLYAYNAYNPELLAYEHAWVDFIKTGFINTSVIKKEIENSWKRCRISGIDPLITSPSPVITQNELNTRIKNRQALVDTSLPFIELLFRLAKGSRLRVDLIDDEGYILISLADKKTMETCIRTNSLPGANRSEAKAGTTSVGLAIIHKQPFQIVGAEHYLQILHRWACSSAPILNENGSVSGVLNVAGMFESVHLHTLGMITATAKAIENEIRIKQKNDQIIIERNQLKATLEAVSDGLIYVNTEGNITQVNFVMEQVLGLNNDEIIGKEIQTLVQCSPPLSIFSPVNNEISQQDITFHGKNGNYSGFLRTKPIFDKNNKMFGAVLIFTKIEEIRRMANKIQKNNAYFTFENIVGRNIKFLDAVYLARNASEFNSRVIIEGESGTGKEIFAQAIHNASSRKNKSFVAVNCGGIPRELIESELFGYEEGAFTGARKGGHPGKFEIADGGTIFLDEIGDMPMEMQIKILRVLQENKIMRIGGRYPISINVRVIAATNKNLEEEVEKNNFREDLFYRLNVFRIKIPALRERKDDIPDLIKYFIERNKNGANSKKVGNEAMDILQNYNWPGNVRQLQNVVERALVMSKKSIISFQDLPSEILKKANKNNIQTNLDNLMTFDDMAKQYVQSTLSAVNNNISEAARLLNISRTTIYKYLGER